MSYLPYLILASIISTVFAYWIHKNPKTTHSTDSYSSSDIDDVISLDDDLPINSRKAQVEQSSPVPFIVLLAVTNVLIIVYIMFGRGRKVHDVEMTFDEFAVNEMGKYISQQVTEERVASIVILPQETDDSQYNISMIKSLQKGLGYKVEVIGEAKPSKSVDRITVGELNNIVKNYPETEMIISLVHLAGSVEEISRSSFPRHVYFAVFNRDGRLHDYIDLISSGFVNLALISKGLNKKEEFIPLKMELNTILDTYFVKVTTQNARQIGHEYRQIVVKTPLETDPFFAK